MDIRPIDELPQDLQERVSTAVHALITDITGTLYDAPATLTEAAELPVEARRDHHLAVLAAAEMLREQLRPVTSLAAYAAGGTTGITTTYAELGSAAGITRQAARERWPGAIPDAKPGRPQKATLEVYLTGGPPSWAGSMQRYPRDEVLEGDLDDIGAYLVTPGEEWPEELEAGVDWRAHYAPESENTRTTWTFQGWLPA